MTCRQIMSKIPGSQVIGAQRMLSILRHPATAPGQSPRRRKFRERLEAREQPDRIHLGSSLVAGR
jgi:hypothetical protein